MVAETVAGAGREAGDGNGREGGKMAELPSGRLSHSPGGVTLREARGPGVQPRSLSRPAPPGLVRGRKGRRRLQGHHTRSDPGVGRGGRGAEDQAGSRHPPARARGPEGAGQIRSWRLVPAKKAREEEGPARENPSRGLHVHF